MRLRCLSRGLPPDKSLRTLNIFTERHTDEYPMDMEQRKSLPWLEISALVANPLVHQTLFTIAPDQLTISNQCCRIVKHTAIG